MQTKKIITILLIAGVVSVLLSGIFIKLVFYKNYIKETTLADDVVITSEWIEVGDKNSLTIEKDVYYLSILLKPSFEIDLINKGIKTPDGVLLKPEIILVDSKGEKKPLAFSGGRRAGSNVYVNFGHEKEIPTEINYSKIMIRNDKPLPVNKLLWAGYNIKDLP